MRTLIVIVGGLLSATIWAAEDPPRTREDVEETFKALDRNNDERISKSEAEQNESLKRRFAGIDASGDGYLSKSEFRARPSDEPFE